MKLSGLEKDILSSCTGNDCSVCKSATFTTLHKVWNCEKEFGDFIHVHDTIADSGLPNARLCKIPVSSLYSKTNIQFIKTVLLDYSDNVACEFL